MIFIIHAAAAWRTTTNFSSTSVSACLPFLGDRSFVRGTLPTPIQGGTFPVSGKNGVGLLHLSVVCSTAVPILFMYYYFFFLNIFYSRRFCIPSPNKTINWTAATAQYWRASTFRTNLCQWQLSLDDRVWRMQETICLLFQSVIKWWFD